MKVILATIFALAASVPAVFGATCTECMNTYTTAIDGATNEAQCTAVKAYATCLAEAYSTDSTAAGCDSLDSKILAVTSKINDLALSITCAVAATCNCEITYLGASRTNDDEKCKSAAIYSACVHGISDTTQAACQTGMTNSNQRAAARQLVTDTCTCASAPAAPTTGETCLACASTYATAIAGATAADICTAAETYASCLVNAVEKDSSAAGCTGVSGYIDVILAATSTCALTTTCECQTTNLKASTSTTDEACVAASNYLQCAFTYATSQAACVTGKTNTDIRVLARAQYSSTCMCSAGHLIRFSAASLMVVLLGFLLKN